MEGFSIGTLRLPSRVVMAPMAGITNWPFRRVALTAGCRVFWTEMIAAEALVRDRAPVVDMLPGADEPRPLVAQLFGREPGSMSEAAAMVESRGADAVDFNLSCPVRRINKGGCGAALMREPLLVGKIVRAMTRRLRIPLTVKIRAGWDPGELNALEVAREAVEGGAAAVVFHGRTRAQGFSGRADHRLAAPLVRELAVPVIVSGDIGCPESARLALEASGAAAVMVGRAAIGDPWVFRRVECALEGSGRPPAPGDAERLALMLEHLRLLAERFGERRGLNLFKAHLSAYLKGRHEAARNRREMLFERSRAALEEKLRRAF